MKPTFSLTRSALWSAAALALCCTLTSCGGDDDDSGGGSTDGVAGESAVKLDAKRIEPMSAKSASAKAQPVAQPALGADAPVTEIVLPAPDASKTTLEAPQKGQPMRIGTVRTIGAQAGVDHVIAGVSDLRRFPGI